MESSVLKAQSKANNNAFKETLNLSKANKQKKLSDPKTLHIENRTLKSKFLINLNKSKEMRNPIV